MSLFVCMRPDCNNIENTSLVTAKVGINNKFPNMYQSEMMGTSSKTSRYANGDFIKHKEDIMMLCCECNCGVTHNEFEYSKATKEELALAKTSKYNMITPYDHDDTIIKDYMSPHGYRLKTTEDRVDESVRKRKVSKDLNVINGLLAMSGLSIYSFLKNNSSRNSIKSEELSNRLIFKAEIKRRIKCLNKEIQTSNDIYRLTELKHQLLEAKKLYKTS